MQKKTAMPGSPPPMRGKAVCTCFFQLGEGITPAYAGKRKNARPFPGAAWDHPRLCGEKPAGTAIRTISRGSPPPMRGKDAAGAFRAAAPGITPAYAGKSFQGEP